MNFFCTLSNSQPLVISEVMSLIDTLVHVGPEKNVIGPEHYSTKTCWRGGGM